MEFPTGLLGVALGIVLIPQLSAANGRKDAAAYSGLLDWGLRLVLLAGAAVLGGVAGVSDRADLRAVSPRRLRHSRGAAVGRGADGLWRRSDGAGRREDPRARLLRTPGHAHAGQDRDRRARADAVDERRPSCPSSGPRRAGAVDRRRRDDQRRRGCSPACGARCDLHAPSRAGAAFTMRVVRSRPRCSRALLWWAEHHIDWVGAGQPPMASASAGSRWLPDGRQRRCCTSARWRFWHAG